MTEITTPKPSLPANRDAGTCITPEGYVRPVAQLRALVQKSQEMAGHFPTEEDLDRGERVLFGELTCETAIKDVLQEYGVAKFDGR